MLLCQQLSWEGDKGYQIWHFNSLYCPKLIWILLSSFMWYQGNRSYFHKMKNSGVLSSQSLYTTTETRLAGLVTPPHQCDNQRVCFWGWQHTWPCGCAQPHPGPPGPQGARMVETRGRAYAAWCCCQRLSCSRSGAGQLRVWPTQPERHWLSGHFSHHPPSRWPLAIK